MAPWSINSILAYDTRFGNPLVVDDDVFFPYDTELNTDGDTLNKYSDNLCNDLFITVLDRKCEVTTSFRLTNTPSIEERKLSIAYLGKDRLLCKWQTIRLKSTGAEASFEKALLGARIGVYDIKAKEWMVNIPFEYVVNRELLSEFEVSGYGSGYLQEMGDDSEELTGSQLFQDNTGRIWFVRFKTRVNGLELVEVKVR